MLYPAIRIRLPINIMAFSRLEIILLNPNVSIHPRCTLCTVGVECLVGFHFHRLFLASLSEIVPAWFVTFVSSVVEDPLCARQLIIPDPTSGLTGRRTCTVGGVLDWVDRSKAA